MDMNDLKSRMSGAVSVFKQELAGLRTGRASADLLSPVVVEAYGSKMPINQVGNISVPDARMITVQVWDKGVLAATEKAIREAGLGLNPAADGDLIRIALPDLTEERRQELVKVARKYAENTRISVRNVRRDGMDGLKKEEKDGSISEDDQHRMGEQIQKLTDETVATIDQLLESKEKEILQV